MCAKLMETPGNGRFSICAVGPGVVESAGAGRSGGSGAEGAGAVSVLGVVEGEWSRGWLGRDARGLEEAFARGVVGRTEGMMFGLSWKVSIEAPDSGQKMVTRIWPGGVWKMLLLGMLEVDGRTCGGIVREEGSVGSEPEGTDAS